MYLNEKCKIMRVNYRKKSVLCQFVSSECMIMRFADV